MTKPPKETADLDPGEKVLILRIRSHRSFRSSKVSADLRHGRIKRIRQVVDEEMEDPDLQNKRHLRERE